MLDIQKLLYIKLFQKLIQVIQIVNIRISAKNMPTLTQNTSCVTSCQKVMVSSVTAASKVSQESAIVANK